MRGVQAGSGAEPLATRIETGNEPGIEHSCQHRLPPSCSIGFISEGMLLGGGLQAARAMQRVQGVSSQGAGQISSVQTQRKGWEERKLPHGPIAEQP